MIEFFGLGRLCFSISAFPGVLIEGQPLNAEMLKHNRPNPKNSIIDKAVCKQKKGGTMEFTAGNYSTAGNPDLMSPEFIDKWHTLFDKDTIQVPCEPLSSMLAGIEV